jgi:hypothetical protein
MALTKAQRDPLPSTLVRSRLFEKVGDRWERKAAKGPSDRQATKTEKAAGRGRQETTGGVDANASNAHLMDVARRLDVSGRPRMSRSELVTAIGRANRCSIGRSLRNDRS